MTTPTTNSDPKELTMTTPTPMPWTWTTNADGSLVCPHRDLSVCPSCAADPRVVEAAGAHFLADVCPCGTPDDANGHHVCPDLPREEVHTTSEGLATVTIYDPSGRVLGIGHGFTLSDARAQAQERARAGADELERTNALLAAEPHVTCDEIGLCNDPTHTSLDCYWRYLLLSDEPGGRIMSQAEWTEAMAATDDDTEGEDICWACDGATDEQTHTCDRYPELTPEDLAHLDSPTGNAALQVLLTEYLEANDADGDEPPSVWDFVLWTLHR